MTEPFDSSHDMLPHITYVDCPVCGRSTVVGDAHTCKQPATPRVAFLRCHACAAWDVQHITGADQARCRRYAPRPAMGGQFNGEGAYGEVWTEFPFTYRYDGCCEGIPL